MAILEDNIDLWLIDLNQKNYSQALTVKYLLSYLENRKQNSLIFKKDQITYLISHVALRFILSKYINIYPQLIKYKFNSYGKPYIVDYPWLHFNLSHSAELACVAISSTEIGVDVEYIAKNLDYLKIANYYFTKLELNLINNQRDNTNRSKIFFKIWTMKEALLKAIGTGLTIKLPIIDFIGDHWQCVDKKHNIWQIKELKLLRKNYIASIAYQKEKLLIINYYNYIFNI